MRRSGRSPLTRSALAAGSLVVATSLLLSGCGSKASETDAANAESCVDTSGPTIKVGALNSLSGTMAISEVTVRDAIDLAVERDQRKRRRDGQADPARRRGRRFRADRVRREGREADQQRLRSRGVRRLDVVEPQGHAAGLRGQQLAALLPRAVRGPGIVEEHLLHRRHHQPADRARAGLPQGEGHQVALPGRQRLRLPADRQPHHQGLRRRPTASRSRARTTRRWAPPTSPPSSTRSAPPTPTRSSTPSTAIPTSRSSSEYNNAGLTPQTMPVVSVSIAEEEVERHRCAEHRRPADRLELLPDRSTPR